MVDFLSYAHEKKKAILKECNKFINNFKLKVFDISVEDWSEDPSAQPLSDPYEDKISGYVVDFMKDNFFENLREMVSWLQKEWLWLPKNEIDTSIIQLENKNLIGAHSFLGIYDEEYYLAQDQERGGDYLNNWRRFLFSIKFIKEELQRIKEWIKNNRERREKEIVNKIYKKNLEPKEKLLLDIKKFSKIAEEKLKIQEELQPKEADYVFGNIFWIETYLKRLYSLCLDKIMKDTIKRTVKGEDDWRKQKFWSAYYDKKKLFFQIFKIKIDSFNFISLYKDNYSDNSIQDEVKELIVILTKELQKIFGVFWLSREKHIKKYGLKAVQIEELVLENNVLEILNSAADKISSQNVITAISEIGYEYKIKPLLDHLENENEHIRHVASKTLSLLENEEPVDCILKIIPTSDNFVNKYLVYYLSKFKDKLKEKDIYPLLSTWVKMPFQATFNSYLISNWSIETITYGDFSSNKDKTPNGFTETFHYSCEIFLDLLLYLVFKFGDNIFYRIFSFLKDQELEIYLSSFMQAIKNKINFENQKLSAEAIETILDYFNLDVYYYERAMYFYKKNDKPKAEHLLKKALVARIKNGFWGNYGVIHINTPKEDLIFFQSFFEKLYEDEEFCQEHEEYGMIESSLKDLKFIIENYEDRKKLEFWDECG